MTGSTITSKTAANEPQPPITELATTTVWSRPGCVQCDATYRHLDLLAIPYKIENLAEHSEKLAEFKARGIMQAPVVEARGMEPWSGFRPDLITKLADDLSELSPPA
ncbi:glutaredoxin domain-containing protein [Arthrobacter bambusae]|uniref:Glutaredoxin-like protein NrdH n=1 Tax=Arthrobacter bambusae TaxID=1338426 RepID=A0AAW8D4X2_9MICC|nr:glutaredoxin domain-containing protein [Arthrobacter bambusae]MDP9903172.1 glutaredoxin-like protein NrdH [Arthrobacter bambusae]MDQ0128834.1 glutaredoxin-like protein NrdH [Arthrobacter bambusae]MDQ0180175.1 glutaredoxin-like protein NrdH [Arthrobacter bambusae]